MPSSDAAIRSIEFVDARDPNGRPVKVGIGTTEGNNVVLMCPGPVAVFAAGQVPHVQKLMREALHDALRDVTVEQPGEQ